MSSMISIGMVPTGLDVATAATTAAVVVNDSVVEEDDGTTTTRSVILDLFGTRTTTRTTNINYNHSDESPITLHPNIQYRRYVDIMIYNPNLGGGWFCCWFPIRRIK